MTGALGSAFITGTDTGVGKTFVTALLLRALRAQGIDAVGFKPICCGAREDAEILRAASGDALTLNEVNPVWLRTPAAPYVAAMIENRPIDLALIRDVYASLRSRHKAVLVEGVGGWLVPIARDFTVANLACEMGLPVILVVANRLGALNHTALTMQSISQHGAALHGIIMNNLGADDDTGHVAETTNREILADWQKALILHEIARDQPAL